MLTSSVAWVMFIRWKCKGLKPVLPAVLATCSLSLLEMLIWVQLILSSILHKKSYHEYWEQHWNAISSAFVLLLWDGFAPLLRPTPLNTVKCSLIPHNAPLTRHRSHRQLPSTILSFTTQPFCLNCFHILNRMQKDCNTFLNNQEYSWREEVVVHTSTKDMLKYFEDYIYFYHEVHVKSCFIALFQSFYWQII